MQQGDNRFGIVPVHLFEMLSHLSRVLMQILVIILFFSRERMDKQMDGQTLPSILSPCFAMSIKIICISCSIQLVVPLTF